MAVNSYFYSLIYLYRWRGAFASNSQTIYKKEYCTTQGRPLWPIIKNNSGSAALAYLLQSRQKQHESTITVRKTSFIRTFERRLISAYKKISL